MSGTQTLRRCSHLASLQTGLAPLSHGLAGGRVNESTLKEMVAAPRHACMLSPVMPQLHFLLQVACHTTTPPPQKSGATVSSTAVQPIRRTSAASDLPHSSQFLGNSPGFKKQKVIRTLLSEIGNTEQARVTEMQPFSLHA